MQRSWISFHSMLEADDPMNKIVAFFASTAIVIVATYLLLLTGIWYTVILAGLIAALIIRKGSLVAFLSGIIGGIIGTAPVVLALPMAELVKILDEVSSLAGISSFILVTLMFLISGLLACAGALIGSFFAPFLEKTGKEKGAQKVD